VLKLIKTGEVFNLVVCDWFYGSVTMLHKGLFGCKVRTEDVFLFYPGQVVPPLKEVWVRYRDVYREDDEEQKYGRRICAICRNKTVRERTCVLKNELPF
jgi:hypothetical protein